MKYKRAGIITKILISALIGYMGISLIALKARVADAEDTRDRLETQAADLARANAELKYDVEHSEDPKAKEDTARNKLGLVKPGEKVFYDIGN
ncbi:MAG: septum formation initiator family protein [Oscillospiraceae bacterium]|nr:septum formation initiator family protein [Oscillospiraceae bacterium]